MRLVLGTLVLLLLATPLAGAQPDSDDDPFSGPAEYTIEVYLGEPGTPTTMAIYPVELVVPQNAVVTFRVVNEGGSDHDFTLLGEGFEFSEEDMRPREDGGEAVKTPLLGPGEAYDLTVTFGPDFEGAIVYICSVSGHRELGMEGVVRVGAAAAEEAQSIEDYGVNYLAYWVGIISFVILFVVLFATFFVFRYGESKNVTDHRTGVAKAQAEGGPAAQPFWLPEPDRVAIGLVVIALIALALYFLV